MEQDASNFYGDGHQFSKTQEEMMAERAHQERMAMPLSYDECKKQAQAARNN